jgi:lysophospholipase L1-like esterase
MIVATRCYLGPAQYLNKKLCFWRQRTSNGDIYPGRQSNGTCTPTYEPDTSADAVLYTRNPTTCRLIDDENTAVVISNTPFEVGTLLNFDRQLPLTKKKALVFYGSSSIVLWERYLPEDFPDYTTVGRGFGGSTLFQGLQEFKRIIYPVEPSVFVIYSGDNDLAGGATPAAVQDSFRSLITITRRFYPNLPIAYISIKPSPARVKIMPQANETNIRIQGDIETLFSGVTFINVWPAMLLPDGQPNPDLFGPDQLHMNRKGYAIWIKAVTDYLESV